MFDALKGEVRKQVDDIRAAGTFKEERILLGKQSARIRVAQGEVLNFCANNYLGLADDPELMAAAKRAIDQYGIGLASVRFICGTQDAHKKLEATISGFLGTEDTILYSSCWDANGGLFETILGEGDAIVSDELNHASIIDGIRLCRRRASGRSGATWPIWSGASRSARRGGEAGDDRHRRRLLDGRRHRRPEEHL